MTVPPEFPLFAIVGWSSWDSMTSKIANHHGDMVQVWVQKHFNSKAWIFFSSSVVEVHVWQAYRKLYVIWKQISFILKRIWCWCLSNPLQCCWCCCSLSNPGQNLSNLEPLSDIMKPRYLKHFTVSNITPFTLMQSHICRVRPNFYFVSWCRYYLTSFQRLWFKWYRSLYLHF